MKDYKKPINERVTKALSVLQKDMRLTDIAAEIGVTQPKLSEILAFRMAAGLDVISGLCVRFSVSPDYLLLGLGGMFRVENEKKEEDSLPSDVVSLARYEKKVEECALLRAELESLKEAVSHRVSGEGAASHTGSLEPALT